ncbi:MAG: hypothetical protein WA005_17360 [Candidatus Binataceae bacterium]
MLDVRRFGFPVGAITLALAIAAMGGTANADGFSAPLVPCGSITLPDSRSNCGSDGLSAGEVTIESDAELSVTLTGAGPNQTYNIVLALPNGGKRVTLGTLITNSLGNGTISIDAALAQGSIGAGNVFLTRGGQAQFFSGIAVLSQAPDFGAALNPCSAVSVPGALSGCGTDAFGKGGNGRVTVDSVTGTLTVTLRNAAAGESYSAVLRSVDGTDFPLGTIDTDAHGNASLFVISEFPSGVIASGAVVLERAASDQYVSGFSVTLKPEVKAQSSGLVRCISVNTPISQPYTLGNCGVDPLDHGSASVNATGEVTVKLVGAAPSTTYEVFYRPLLNTGDIDTGLALTANTNGNATGIKKGVFISGDVGSGALVVKGSGGFDEFVPGFTVR